MFLVAYIVMIAIAAGLYQAALQRRIPVAQRVRQLAADDGPAAAAIADQIALARWDLDNDPCCVEGWVSRGAAHDARCNRERP